jgi:GTP cyclohydrolase I
MIVWRRASLNGHMDARGDARGGMSEKSNFVCVADIKTPRICYYKWVGFSGARHVSEIPHIGVSGLRSTCMHGRHR